jgi:hypothetical protein
MQFNIWFSGCDANGTNERNYDIYKDGVLIWTVIDEQGESRTSNKPHTHTNNENTPANMEVYDECSKTKGKQRACDSKMSKFKKVMVVLKQITDAHFGTYSLNNTKGGEVVQVERMVDGYYSAWTPWSAWIEAKGGRERTRTCTEPVNGGDPCTAQGAPKQICSGGDDCADGATYSQWSDWSCKDVCYNPEKHAKDTWRERRRTCTDGMPKHSINNCDDGNVAKLVDEEKTCGGEFRLPMCPKMKSIEITVCNFFEAGTDDNVLIEFRNSFHRETCSTDWLETWGNDWARDSTVKWNRPSNLASCGKNVFRPIGALSFRFVTNTVAVNLHHDDLHLCKVEAQFGMPGMPGYSIWQWEGTNPVTNNFDDSERGSSYYNSQSNWTDMTLLTQ